MSISLVTDYLKMIPFMPTTMIIEKMEKKRHKNEIKGGESDKHFPGH